MRTRMPTMLGFVFFGAWTCVFSVQGAWAAEEGDAADVEAEAEAEDDPTPDVDPEIFDSALKDFYERNYADAAAGFWGYIRFGGAAAENYEWSQFFLAESLRKLELWHGAVQFYYLVAKTRSRPEILPEALRRLERIARSRPVNEDLVLRDLLYDSEFGALPDDLDSWVHYIQGLFDYRNGFRTWGKRHFSQVDERSYYGLKAMYVQGVDALKRKKDSKAVELFNRLLEHPVDAPDIKNDTHLSLARLHFDQARYEEALAAYNRVQQTDLSFGQAQLLLEKAWVSFYLGQYRKAMGLLHALNAPSYVRFFLPDAFVLRGLIFKDLCHYIPAKRATRAFRFHYGRALKQLRARQPMDQIARVRAGATQEGEIARRTAFLRTLQAERQRIEAYDSNWEDVGLDAHLRRLYDFEIKEQARLWRLRFRKVADEVALQLLEVEEQANLLDYEVGLDIFKRLQASQARQVVEKPLTVPYDSANVYYEFDTEFWNDELHSYEFFVTNRCFEKGATGGASP